MVAKKCFLIVVNLLYVCYMTTAILWVLCVSRIPEISQHTFWSFGSGNILSAHYFQRLNKGVEREKTEHFSIFTTFSDVPYTNGCFPEMAAITLKIPVLKVIPEPHSWPVPFYCRLLDTCLLIHLDIRSLARLLLVSTVPQRLIVAGVFWSWWTSCT